jgi:Carboxypeptidase regulatory-like domain
MKHSLLFLGIVFGLGLVSTLPANADNLYASIRGTVEDSTGAVIPGVKLTAMNTATNISYTATSGQSGAYSFPQLPIGDYNVHAEQTGFKSYQASGIHLDLNQIYDLDIKLSVGEVAQQLVVEANPVQVDSTDMQLGATVTAQEIVDIPLNGRNWTQLQQLQPGVVSATDRFGPGMNGGGGYSGNGAETQQNAFLINGNDSNDPTLNTALIIPSPDAIGEFRMITSTLNPEYGRNSGTIINAAIKNGTNAFHGDLFEFYRDNFLDAKPWFAPTAVFHLNQFGATLGGPIWRDHAFFFFSYQGTREKFPEAGAVPSVPVFTPAQRAGDFGAGALGLTGNLSPFPMYGDSASPCAATLCPAGTPYTTLFSTGAIPTTDLNPLALKLMNQFVPLPNTSTNAYQFNPTTTQNIDQYIYRVDFKLTNSDSLWGYGMYQTAPSSDTLPFIGATLPGFADSATRHYQQYAVSWMHTFSPTAINEVRGGYTRFNYYDVNPVNPINPTTYGFTGITPQEPSLASLPVVTLNGLFTLGFSSDGPQPRVQNTYQFVDNFSKVIGHHTVKAGFTMERIQINNPFYNNLGGDFTFSGSGVFSTGNPGADFLLGIPDGYSQGSGSKDYGRAQEYYSYIQDQWQVRKNLTVTIGTGWDIETPWINQAFGGEIMSAFRPEQQSVIFPSMPAGFVYPGDPGVNQYGGPSIHYGTLAPRVGFAWSPANNWAVHAGVGLYYDRSEEELALQTLTNPPFAITSNGVGALGTTPAFATPFSSVNPAPVNGIPSGSRAIPFPFTPPSPHSTFDPSVYYPVGLAMSTSDPNLTVPRSLNFNLTVEHQVSKSTIVSLAYVGNIGRHEEGAYDLNMAGVFPGQNAIAAATFPTCTSGLSLGTSACPQTPAPGSTPYPINVYGQPGQQATGYNSNYNSLQATVNRRFSNGLQFLAAYTWSRYFDETSNLENSAFNFPGINPFNPRSMYAPSANDAPQRFVVSYTYTLPFYKFAHRWRKLTDGWNVSGIYTLQHGTPDAVFDFSAHSLTCDFFNSFYTCPDRANWTGVPLQFGNPRNSGNLWVTNAPATLTVGSPGSYVGTATRNPFYGPGLNYGDMAIEKNIYFTEARYLQLRFETFNTFNHANFANPATPGFSAGGEDASEPNSFGQIFSVNPISTNGDGRVVQLGAKFYF